jgi:hypothetical protein
MQHLPITCAGIGQSRGPKSRFPGWLLGVCVFCCASTTALAQSTEDELTVRDVSVFQVSAYGQQLNARALFRTTLPAVIPSQRPSAPRSEGRHPVPVGIITFGGPPTEDIDVMLEFDSGRFLGHWPAANKRSQRLLWRSLNVDSQPENVIGIPDEHWLAPLLQADRLFVHSDSRSNRFLLYDAEVGYTPQLKVTLDEGVFSVANSGQYAVHDVMICKPVEGRWRVASVDEAPGTGVKPASGEQPAASPESVFENSATTAQPAASPQPAAAPANAVPAAPATPPATVVVADSPAEAEAVAQPAAATENADAAAQPQQQPTGPATQVPFVGDDAIDALAALNLWRARLSELGLGDPEIDHVLRILEERALQADTTMVVYRLDPQALEELLPLEVTPLPDRIVRVALVILQDADPEIEAKVVKLIAQLGDPLWKNRVAAQQQLRDLSQAALPKLTEAVNNSDVEIAFRAEQLLEELQTANQ